MAAALSRLAGTRIETNIETNGQRERAGFGLIDSWRVIERDNDDRMVAIEVTLPDWLYRAIQAGQVLTLDKDYFRLRKPLERRLYELARKHCGANQAKWMVSLTVLHQKSGSRSALKRFRHDVTAIAETQHLPGYLVQVDRVRDMVAFFSRKPKGQIGMIQQSLGM